MLPSELRGGDERAASESLVSPRSTTGTTSAASSSTNVTTWVMWATLMLFGLCLGALVGLTLTHIFNGIPAQHHISADDADAIDALINQGPHHVVETIGRPADSPGQIMVNDTMNVGGVLYADAVFVVDTLTPTRAVNPLINVLRYIDRQILAHAPITTCCTEFDALVTRVENVEGDIALLSTNVAGALVDVADVLADVAVLTVRIDGHDATLATINGQVFLLQATDAAQQVEIDTLRVDVNAIAVLVNATAGMGNITAVVGRVQNNTLSISALEIRTTATEACCVANTADISALGIQVTTIEDDIVWVWGNLTALGLQVATNTAGVATNTAGVATNTAAVAGLTSNVTALVGQVNANEACCITNAADVAAVVTRVDQHDVQFVWVHNNITAQGVLIAVSIADIAQLQLDFATLAAQLNATASFGNVTMLTMQVQNNTLVIAAFEIRITANEACCTTNAADVAAVVARVDDHDVQIVWIWGNLTTQGLQTASNTASVASLVVDVAALDGRVNATEACCTANAADTAAVVARVDQHDVQFVWVWNNITGQGVLIAATAADVAQLKLDFAILEATVNATASFGNVTMLTVQVQSNTLNISAIATRVDATETCCVVNAADIAAVVARADQHDVQFVWVWNNITGQGVLIAANAADIVQIQLDVSELQLDVTVLQAALNATASFGNVTMLTTTVQAHTLTLADHDVRITANEACCLNTTADLAALALRVTTTEANVATNTGDIAIVVAANNILEARANATEAAVTNNTAGIVANAGDIATNAADIATNAGDIATNAAGVAANAGAIVVLESNVTDHNMRLGQIDIDQATQNTQLDAVNATAVAAAAATVINAGDIATNAGDIATNAGGIATNAADIAANIGDIATNAVGVASNAADIVVLESNVTAHGVHLGQLDAGQIVQNTQIGNVNTTAVAAAVAAATNAGDIATNAANIATNAGDIATNAGDIAINAADIATNVADIATNAADIATNAGDIATNAGDIATNAGDIATNAGDIATNAGDIATNAGDIATNAGDIATNTGDIATNAADIATNVADIATNVADIATNAADIATNAGDIATNAGDIATNAGDIATNTGDIAVNAADIVINTGDIATNAADIATNTGDIATNAADIATNAGDIATNAADIATNVGDIVVLEGNVTAQNARLNQLDAGQIVQNTKIDNLNASAVANAAAVSTIDATIDTTDLALLNTEQSTPSTSALLRSMLTDIDSLGMSGSGANCSTILVTNTDAAFGIEEALVEAASRSPSPSNPVAIELCAGTHVVDNTGGPLYVPNSVSIVAPANYMATIIVPADPTKSVLRIAGGNRQLRGFTIAAPTATTFGVVEEGDGTTGITTMAELYYIGHGLLQTNVTSEIAILMRSVIIRITKETSVGIHIQNTGSDFPHYFTSVGVLADSSLVNEIATVGFKYEVVTPLTSTIVIDGANFKRVGTAIHLDIDGIAELDNLSAADVDEAVIHVVGTAATVYTSGVLKIDLDGDALHDAPFLTGNSSAHVHLFGDQTEYVCQESTDVPERVGVYVDTNAAEGDVLRSMADVSIGMPERPYSLHTGDGKHTFRNLLIYTSVGGGALTSAVNGNCFGNDTVDLSTSVNSAIYLSVNVPERLTGDMFQHFGLYVTVQTAAVYGGSGSIVAEFYDGTTWRPFATMSFLDQAGFPSDANTPFVSVGNQYINYNPHIATDHLVYPESAGTTYGAWTKNDPISSGTDRYWVRFRVASALTTGPQLSYVAYTGNGHEWGINGEHLYHGKARKYRKVPTATGDMGGANIGSDPGERDVFHSTLEFGLNNNLLEPFTDSNRLHWVLLLPGDVDTSAPIRMTMYHSTTNTNTGNVVLDFAWASAAQGDGVYDNSGQATSDLNPNERSDTIVRAITDTEQLSYQSFLLDIPEYTPISSTNGGSLVMVRMNRLGASFNDTFINDILIMGINFEYVQRMDGVPFYEFV